MPDWILLLPILFPLVGAFGFTVAQSRISTRVLPWLPIIFVAIEIGAILVNIAPGNHNLIISSWNLAAFSIVFQIDGITLLLLLTMFVPLAVLWLIAPPRAPLALLPMLVLTTAIVLTTAANLMTVYLAWALLDVAIFTWRLAFNIERETALRAFAVSQVAAFALLAGALLLGADRAADGAFLIALALWARLALFPFHWTLPTHGSDPYDVWLARGAPLLAASNLWLHWWTLRVDAPLMLIGSLSVAAIIATAIWIWREEQPSRAAVVSAAHALAF